MNPLNELSRDQVKALLARAREVDATVRSDASRSNVRVLEDALTTASLTFQTSQEDEHASS